MVATFIARICSRLPVAIVLELQKICTDCNSYLKCKSMVTFPLPILKILGTISV